MCINNMCLYVCVCLIGCREASAAVHEDELHRTADDTTADDVMSDGGETTDLMARATGRCLLSDT